MLVCLISFYNFVWSTSFLLDMFHNFVSRWESLFTRSLPRSYKRLYSTYLGSTLHIPPTFMTFTCAIFLRCFRVGGNGINGRHEIRVCLGPRFISEDLTKSKYIDYSVAMHVTAGHTLDVVIYLIKYSRLSHWGVPCEQTWTWWPQMKLNVFSATQLEIHLL